MSVGAAGARALHHVEANQGRFDASVAHVVLNGADVGAVLEAEASRMSGADTGADQTTQAREASAPQAGRALNLVYAAAADGVPSGRATVKMGGTW